MVFISIWHSISLRKWNQVSFWWIRMHYPYLLQHVFMCESIQFDLDVLEHLVFCGISGLMRASASFLIFRLIIFFVLAPRSGCIFVKIVLISLRRVLTERLQLCQQCIHHCFLLFKHCLLPLSQLLLGFEPLEKPTHFISACIDEGTS